MDYKQALKFFCEEIENKKFKISRSTFYSAVKELILNNFIAESIYSNQYYINPSLFFNGNRLKLIKEYRVKKEKKWVEQKNEK